MAEPEETTERVPRFGRVLFSFDAVNEEELSIQENQQIAIVGTPEPGWWRGYIIGVEPRKIGLIPAPYLEVTEDAPEDKEKPK